MGFGVGGWWGRWFSDGDAEVEGRLGILGAKL